VIDLVHRSAEVGCVHGVEVKAFREVLAKKWSGPQKLDS
jgi:hypothetical protein